MMMTQARDEIHDKTHEFMDELSKQRWDSHTREHGQIAESLKQYKIDSNEWRSTLIDLRGQFLTRDTYDSKHEALIEKVDALDKRVSFFEDREKGAATVLGSTRAIILTVGAIATTIITIILFVTRT